jgi:hypothetical protein
LAGGVERVTGQQIGFADSIRFSIEPALTLNRGGFAPPAIPTETPYDLALQLFRTDKK